MEGQPELLSSSRDTLPQNTKCKQSHRNRNSVVHLCHLRRLRQEDPKVWSTGCLKPRVLEDPLLLSPHPQKSREGGGGSALPLGGAAEPWVFQQPATPWGQQSPQELPALRCGRSTNCPDLRVATGSRLEETYWNKGHLSLRAAGPAGMASALHGAGRGRRVRSSRSASATQ